MPAFPVHHWLFVPQMRSGWFLLEKSERIILTVQARISNHRSWYYFPRLWLISTVVCVTATGLPKDTWIGLPSGFHTPFSKIQQIYEGSEHWLEKELSAPRWSCCSGISFEFARSATESTQYNSLKQGKC